MNLTMNWIFTMTSIKFVIFEIQNCYFCSIVTLLELQFESNSKQVNVASGAGNNNKNHN